MLQAETEIKIPTPQIVADNEGFGLKNGNTNFYSDLHGPQTFTSSLLDHHLEVELQPTQWVWDYGDGTPPVKTTHPGEPQKEFNEETPTSHKYAETGEYNVTMTTTFTGRYRIDGGAWESIPGTATRTSDVVVADIWKSTTRNVYETCEQNPYAWGCPRYKPDPNDR